MIDAMIRLSSQGQRIATFGRHILKINYKFFNTFINSDISTENRKVDQKQILTSNESLFAKVIILLMQMYLRDALVGT